MFCILATIKGNVFSINRLMNYWFICLNYAQIVVQFATSGGHCSLQFTSASTNGKTGRTDAADRYMLLICDFFTCFEQKVPDLNHNFAYFLVFGAFALFRELQYCIGTSIEWFQTIPSPLWWWCLVHSGSYSGSKCFHFQSPDFPLNLSCLFLHFPERSAAFTQTPVCRIMLVYFLLLTLWFGGTDIKTWHLQLISRFPACFKLLWSRNMYDLKVL